MSKCKWRVIKEQYSNQQELIDLLQNSIYKDLARQWDCHVDVVYALRKNLGIKQKRTDIDEFLKIYSKEQLEDLYYNVYDRHLLKMAEALNVYHTTLTKIFDYLDIQQKPHHMSEYIDVIENLRFKANERAKIKSPIGSILQDPNWRKKADSARVKAGTGRQPHKVNRKIKDIDSDLLKQEVVFRGVLEAAKYFNLSQNTLRKWCKDNSIKLIEGPRKARTETEEYKKASRARGVLGLLSVPRKNTKIEILLQNELIGRKVVFELGHELLDRTVPDAFIEPNICVYSDGCYFHFCLTHKQGNFDKEGHLRQTPHAIANNKRPESDRNTNEKLEKCGYKVFRFWEHEIKKDVKACVDQIESYINEEKKKDPTI